MINSGLETALPSGQNHRKSSL